MAGGPVHRCGAIALAALAALALSACGERDRLVLDGVEPDPSFVDSGVKRESSQPSGAGTQRFYRYEDLDDGDELTWTVELRNVSGEPVRVVGVRSDADREKVLRPTALGDGPVEIPAGATRSVTVRGAITECEAGDIETLYTTGTTELELESPPGEDAGTTVVDLDVAFEVASDAAC